MVVIFGEVIPQSVCVRYGLSIGAYMAPFVLGLMWLLAPIAWPTAKLLDKLLGEDHGTIYKKSGLKTLVTLHKTLGTSPTDRLNQDEVTIISAVLDLKDKAVGDIMTPMEDVFTMSADTVLDEPTMNAILSAGYSRIPIYEPGNPQNFVGMLLVKILITYDPEDCTKVGEFALATLPETRPETSCLDIVNFFQEGKSHMVLVSEYPGENYGAIGVVTLEDCVEELLGEEIIDESDVFVDVHKAIRRMAPAPKARIQKGHMVETVDHTVLHATADHLIDFADENVNGTESSAKPRASGNDRTSPAIFGTSPKTTFIRRSSNGTDGSIIQVRGNVSDMREHLKHLGPSNLASRPKTTRYNTVKIKPGQPTRADSRPDLINTHDSIAEGRASQDYPVLSADERDSLLSSAYKEASDRGQTTQQRYGSMNHAASSTPNLRTESGRGVLHASAQGLAKPSRTGGHSPSRPERGRFESNYSDRSRETIDSLDPHSNSLARAKRSVTRSGSITENIIEAGGIRKVILETHTSSGEDRDERDSRQNLQSQGNSPQPSPTGTDEPPKLLDGAHSVAAKEEEVKKKRRRQRKKKGGKDEGDASAAGSSSLGKQ
jgi:metal transporter CNNM